MVELTAVTINGLSKRASKQVYKVFELNRVELELLCSMATLLLFKGKERAGIQAILRFRLYNPFHAKQETAVFYSLLDRDCILEHKAIRGYNYSISELGKNVLRYYEECMKEVTRVL